MSAPAASKAPPASSGPEWIRLVIVGVSLLGLCAFMFLAFMPYFWKERQNGQLIRILIVKPWVHLVLSYASVVLVALMLALSAIGLRRGHKASAVFALLAALFGFPPAIFFWSHSPGFPPAQMTFNTPDKEYLLTSEIGSAHNYTWTLNLLERDGRFFRHYKVLAENTGASLPFINIVRPDTPDARGEYVPYVAHIYFNASKYLCGLYQDTCFFIYEPVSGTFTEELESVDPFFLVGEKDGFHQGDVERIEAAITRNPRAFGEEPDWVKRPAKAALQLSLKHPNPKVRELAEKWLKYYP